MAAEQHCTWTALLGAGWASTVLSPPGVDSLWKMLSPNQLNVVGYPHVARTRFKSQAPSGPLCYLCFRTGPVSPLSLGAFGQHVNSVGGPGWEAGLILRICSFWDLPTLSPVPFSPLTDTQGMS